MRNSVFTGNQRAYLLAAVVLHLNRKPLMEHDREIYEHLRDFLAKKLEARAFIKLPFTNIRCPSKTNNINLLDFADDRPQSLTFVSILTMVREQMRE